MGMLVLERRPNEEVIITVPPSNSPTRIRVMVTNIRREKDAVALGFDAPPNVAIDREEVAASKAAGPKPARAR